MTFEFFFILFLLLLLLWDFILTHRTLIIKDFLMHQLKAIHHIVSQFADSSSFSETVRFWNLPFAHQDCFFHETKFKELNLKNTFSKVELIIKVKIINTYHTQADTRPILLAV